MHSHIITPQKPTLVSAISDNQASYVIKPLNPGYGVTIANSLRRVMLSSLPGVAVAYYKIKHVDHEFSTINGVAEDVVDITLNLKALRFTMVGDEAVTLTLKASGSKTVKGKDIKLPSTVSLINPEQEILTLTSKDASIDMELVLERGVGFKPDTRLDDTAEVGLIAVDSIFTPIVRVSYDVEDMRVGDKTNYNKVIFNITTDGTITPLQAIEEASKILVEQFNALLGGTEELSQNTTVPTDGVSTDDTGETSSLKVESLGLTQRITKSLTEVGITNVAQLIQMTDEELLQVKGVSAKGLESIRSAISKYV